MGYIQSDIASNNAAGGNIAVTMASNPASGNRIIIGIFWILTAAITDISSVTDSLGTSYSLIGFAASSLHSTWGMVIYYGVAPSSGANTVTCTFVGTPTFRRIIATEVSGITQPIGFSNKAATGKEITSGDVRALANDTFVYGQVLCNSTATVTAGVNELFTKREDDASSAPFASEDAIKSIAGATTAKFTQSVSQDWQCQVAIFSPTSVVAPTMLPQEDRRKPISRLLYSVE